jgi:hypothetical protein
MLLFAGQQNYPSDIKYTIIAGSGNAGSGYTHQISALLRPGSCSCVALIAGVLP